MNQLSKTPVIGFIGAGQMARALAGGFVASGQVQPEQVYALDAMPAAAASFAETIAGSHVAAKPSELISHARMVILAVKPHHAEAALRPFRGHWRAEHWLVSIVAGKSMAQLTQYADADRWIRVMPNTSCLVRCGALAFCRSNGITDDEVSQTQNLLGSVGYVTEVIEESLDAVTGLSGSGPAFIYQVIEALGDGGVRMGLPREIAMRLAAETVKGAAEMVLSTGQHPAVLKDQVTSPGGTTIAGLQSLEQDGLRAALINAVQAATHRSRELA